LYSVVQAAFHDDNGPDGEVWVSYTDFSGLKFVNILAANIDSEYTMYPFYTGLFKKNVHVLLIYRCYYLCAASIIAANFKYKYGRNQLQ